LAKKKTYPVLFSLYLHGLLPPNAIIYGFARSKLDDADFKKQISRQYCHPSLHPCVACVADALATLKFQEGARGEGERLPGSVLLLQWPVQLG
jgi:glucose-6-phosphate 1-dehydrogenase